MTDIATHLRNGSSIPLGDLPVGTMPALRSLILEKVAGGSHIASLSPVRRDSGILLLAVLTNPHAGDVIAAAAAVGDSFASLTPECPEAQAFEREIAEQHNIVPLGHPWLKPLRFHRPFLGGKRDQRLSKWFGGARGPSVMDFYQVDGPGVHEVAVGPVHAGVIEPGHFRFQCHGEKVMHLEISLGYQHRGIEKSLPGGPTPATRHMMETAAGDTTCGHGLAYVMNIESLAGIPVSDAAARARGIGLELERIANHTGDLGALAGDVGFLPTASYCGRLRGDILNLTALLCGNRFGRGWIVPGGVGHAVDTARASQLRDRLRAALRDIRGAIRLLFASPSVMARFEGAGPVDRQTAYQLGLVGPAGRASGLETDVRLEAPAGPYALATSPRIDIKLGAKGDVLDRAEQRAHEIETSAQFIEHWLDEGAETEAADAFALHLLRPDRLAVSLTEGWRGRVCHVAVTDGAGRFLAYKITDPSFHNWPGLAMALRGQQISDFPLCNKSFNLSYCGHDL